MHPRTNRARRFLDRRYDPAPLRAALVLLGLGAAGCGPRTQGPGPEEPPGGDPADAGTTPGPPEAGTSDAPTVGPDLSAGGPDAPLPPPLPVDLPESVACIDEPAPRAVVRVPPAEITECADGFATCSGRLVIQIENCGPAGLVIETIVVTNPPPRQGTMELAFAPGTTIRVGETLEREGFVAWEGSYEVRVNARERDGTPMELGPATGTVTNALLASAKAECETCRGEWGRWGITQSEGCICGTSDEGKECRDGADCEGPCVFERFEEVSPGMGVPIGLCAGQRALFGCNPLIRDGASADPPQTLPGRSPTICVD